MWSAIHGRLYYSPLHESPLRRALDIGTGRGLWAMEFGMFLTVNLSSSPPPPSKSIFLVEQAEANFFSPPLQLVDIETAK